METGATRNGLTEADRNLFRCDNSIINTIRIIHYKVFNRSKYKLKYNSIEKIVYNKHFDYVKLYDCFMRYKNIKFNINKMKLAHRTKNKTFAI